MDLSMRQRTGEYIASREPYHPQSGTETRPNKLNIPLPPNKQLGCSKICSTATKYSIS